MNYNMPRLFKKSFYFFVVAISLAANFFIFPIPTKADLTTEEYLIKFKDNRQAQSIISEKEAKEKDKIDKVDIYKLNIRSDKAKQLEKDPRVEFIEKNHQRKALSAYTSKITAPNDPGLNNQYGLTQIGATYAWDYSQGSASMIIAILDTGIDGTHADLNGKVTAGYDFVNGVPILANANSDDYGHGTAVAGVAAAKTNNGVGMAGTCWNCTLMPVKVLNNFGVGDDFALSNGIVWAAQHGAAVINMSLGGPDYSATLASTLYWAWLNRTILVAAAGNDGLSVVDYPAGNNGVLAVGATDSSGQRWGSSNYGSELDLMAPGVSIYSTTMGGGYSYYTGTSLASSFVAGVAATGHIFQPGQGNDAIVNMIQNNASKNWMGGRSWTDTYGWGRVDFIGALVNPAANDYRYQVMTQNSYPGLNPGGAYNFVLGLKNIGQTVWSSDSVHLGTDRALDRVSSFIREGDGPSGWISPNRIRMQENYVLPGSVATFSFWMRAPGGMNPGVYREYFRPVVDGLRWMEDQGLYWQITINGPSPSPPSYQYEVANQNAYPTINRGSAYQFVLSLRNTGSQSWYQHVVHLGTDRGLDRISALIREGDGPSGWVSPNRIMMQEYRVDPGQTATFVFWMTAGAGMTPGIYREYFRPVADGVAWMEDRGIFWYVGVR